MDYDLATEVAHFREPKDNKKSAKLRQIGNRHFNKDTITDYLIALTLYNKSICYAELDSENLSIGYGNRSAIYFELKMYAECLQNIEMARNVPGFPMRLSEKLDKREEDCHTFMKQKDCRTFAEVLMDHPVEPKLSFPPHENVPFIANCLELRRNDKYGRHVITNRDLEVGQIIAIEEPYCTSLSKKFQYERCENCCLEKSRNLIPCNECTVVMFCSEECRSEGWNRFHRFECPIIDVIGRCLRSSDKRISLRATFCALSQFQSINALKSFTEEIEGQDNNVFNVRLEGEAAKYASVCSMDRSENDVYAEAIDIALREVCLAFELQSEDLSENERNEETIKTLVKLSHNHFLATLNNRSAIADVGTTIDVFKSNMSVETLTDPTLGIYPFRFLLNHSCHPNICSCTYGNNIVIIVLRPIKAGEQIFDNYFFHHGRHSLAERKEGLNFECTCIACEEDYPMINHMPRAPSRPPPKLWSECMVQMYECNRNAAITNLKVIVSYLQENDRHYPSLEVATISSYMRHAVELVYGKEIPLSALFEPIGGPVGEKLRMIKKMFQYGRG